jgi:hypothetical protein
MLAMKKRTTRAPADVIDQEGKEVYFEALPTTKRNDMISQTIQLSSNGTTTLDSAWHPTVVYFRL